MSNFNDSGNKDDEIIGSGFDTADLEGEDSECEIVSAGIRTETTRVMKSGFKGSDEIFLNGIKYTNLRLITQTDDYEVFILTKDTRDSRLYLYYPNFSVKGEILSKIKVLSHENVLKLEDYGFYEGRFFEISEIARGGSLGDIDDNCDYKYIPIRDLESIRRILRGVAHALEFCHSKKIIHRGIRPDSIYFETEDFREIQIGNFDCSSGLDEGFSRMITTHLSKAPYAAPELYQAVDGKVIIGKEIDYYALGLVLLQVWSGKALFQDMGVLSIMRIKIEDKIELPDDMPDDLKHLIAGLLRVEPSKRWGYDEIQRWLRGEYQPESYSEKKVRYKEFNFGLIDGKEHLASDPEELAGLLEIYPEKGKMHLYMGTIQSWLKEVDQSLYLEIVNITEKVYKDNQDTGLLAAIYSLDQARPFKSKGGIECSTAEEIGDVLERERKYYSNHLKIKDADLYIFLETRGYKNEADAFRKYYSLYANRPDVALNHIILDLHGRDRLKLGNCIYFQPEDLLLADESVKENLARMLLFKGSRLSIWLTQFSNLKNRIEKYRILKRYTPATLAYALLVESPFDFMGQKVGDLNEFKRVFAEILKNNQFLMHLEKDSSFTEEADFWLWNYHNTSLSRIILEYLQETLQSKKELLPDSATIRVLIGYVIKDFYTKSNDLEEFSFFEENFKPCLEKLHSLGLVDKTLLEEYKMHSLKLLEELANRASHNREFNNVEEIISKIKRLNKKHPYVLNHKRQNMGLLIGKLYRIFVFGLISIAFAIVVFLTSFSIIDYVRKELKLKEKLFLVREEAPDKLLFRDDFEGDSEVLKSLTNFNVSLDKDLLEIKTSNPIRKQGEDFVRIEDQNLRSGEFFGLFIPYNRNYTDFIVQTDIIECSGNNFSGIYFCRFSVKNNQNIKYAFMINRKGMFKIIRAFESGVEKGIKSKTGKDIYRVHDEELLSFEIAYIENENDLSFPQRLKVVCKRNKMMFYLDNQLLKSLKVDGYSSHDTNREIGFVVEHSQTILFDNFTIHSIKEKVKRNILNYKRGFTTSQVNLRKGPGTEFEVIGVLNDNTKIYFKGIKKLKDKSLWFSIIVESGSCKGNAGYLHGSYVQF